MTRWDLSSLSRTISMWLIGGICVSVVVLAWFGYRATLEWRRSSDMLEQRRAEQTADLFVRALARDMRGVESLVLRGVHLDHNMLSEPSVLSDVVAGAFARYPYPESFFAWSGADDPSRAVFFARADRRPNWLPLAGTPIPFPVTIVHNPAAAQRLMELIATDAAHGQRFSVGDARLGDQAYQFVARLIYRTSRRTELEHVLGFLVNLNWVRESYFAEITAAVGHLAAAETGLAMAVLDEHGAVVAGAADTSSARPAAIRRIRPLFVDPSLVTLNPPDDVAQPYWTIRVSADADSTRTFALRGSDRTIVVTTAAAVALGFGLLLTARALRASADLAKLRCDFVSSVTHELKTPLSTISIVGETLSRGRLQDGTQIREYAQLVDQEAKRLTRLVDNMLAYSRVTDVSEVYSFEPLVVADLIEDVLRGFQAQLAHRDFQVSVDIPADLPPVWADRTALGLVFDNLVDNALRYSGDSRWLAVKARHDGRDVRIDVLDRGVGIPLDELFTVVRRFVRGRQAGLAGSGLGLAIASRVVKDHGGRLRIDSDLAVGTTVHVSLPVTKGAR